MAEIRPFRGIRYSAASSGNDLGDYLSPPFDMITPSVQQELLERSPYNIVRLELAPLNGENRYSYVADTQHEWTSKGVLVRDDAPSMYVTEERFSYGGVEQTRRGFIAAVRLEEYDRGIIFPHENTRDAWVQDRVEMMQASRSALSPLLVVFQDDIRSSIGGMIRAIAGGPPTETASMPGGHEMRLWQVTDRGSISLICELMRASQLFIADGHHRYEAAMRYRSSIRAKREISQEESVNFRMMHLVSIGEPGLITRGYHRLISEASPNELEGLKSQIRDVCDVTPWKSDRRVRNDETLDEFASVLKETGESKRVFGVYGLDQGAFHVATFKSGGPTTFDDQSTLERSEYFMLHRSILEEAIEDDRMDAVVDFQYDIARVVAAVDSGESQLGIIMRSLPMHDFIDIVSRGHRLPPKATNFYPKPPAGAVIQALDGAL